MSSRRSMTRDIHESIRLLLGKNVKVLLKSFVKLELKSGGDKTENRVLVFTAHRMFVVVTTRGGQARIDQQECVLINELVHVGANCRPSFVDSHLPHVVQWYTSCISNHARIDGQVHCDHVSTSVVPLPGSSWCGVQASQSHCIYLWHRQR